MILEDIPPEELNWTTEPVIGILLMSAENDSNGYPINPHKRYWVAKHIPSGMIVIALAI